MNELRTKSSDSNAQVEALNLDLKSKSEELQASQDALASLKSDLNAHKENNEILQTKAKDNLAILQESKNKMEQDLKQEVDKLNKEILDLNVYLDKANAMTGTYVYYL